MIVPFLGEILPRLSMKVAQEFWELLEEGQYLQARDFMRLEEVGSSRYLSSSGRQFDSAQPRILPRTDSMSLNSEE